MFKKISLCATAVAAEFKGTPIAIPLCTAQALTAGTKYTTTLNCNRAAITLTGGVDPPKDNTATDGYSATMTVGYMEILNSSTDEIAYGVCVIPKESAVAEDTAYMKAPRGMCLGLCSGAGSAGDGTSAWTSGNTDILGGFFGHISYADLYTNNAAKADADWTKKEHVVPTNVATIDDQTAAALIPTGITTMDAVTTYGAITVPAATFYDD